MSMTQGGFVPSGWISGYVPNTLDKQESIYVDPGLPPGDTILGLTLLPIHIFDNDPHPEPFPGLTVDFAPFGREFLIRASTYNPRDSIQFFEWQVTYGKAPADYLPLRWLSGSTSHGNVPQRIATRAPEGTALNGLTVLPMHVFNNDPNPEPWPGLRVDFGEGGDVWLYDDGGPGPRDSIQFFMWQGVLGPASSKPGLRGYVSGATQHAKLPITVEPKIPEGKRIVSVDVFPIHVYHNDPKPEWWPALRVTFPTPRSFEIKAGDGPGPRDSIQWFLWQVTFADGE